MTIVWKYLDKRSATVAVLKDYHSMQFIIENTDEEIKNEHDRMVSLGGLAMDGMPHSHNPRAGEERILQGLEEIDVLKERYRQAVEYMHWFQPAWKELSNTEQDVLRAFYEDEDCYGANAVDVIAERYHVSRPSAYRKKERAVNHMMTLLYGKE